MGDLRRSRGVPPTGKVRDFRVRDEALLYANARFGVIRTSQDALLQGMDKSACSRRLAQLVGSGWLQVIAPARLSDENAYVLTPKGREKLLSLGYEERDLFALRPAAAVDQHLRLVTDVRLALILACRRADVRVGALLADLDLRRLAGKDVPPVVPDLIAELSTDAETVRLLFEVDRETESAAWFVSHKGTAIAELAARKASVWGLVWPWTPVIVTTSDGRLIRLARGLTRSHSAGEWLGTTLAAVQTIGPLGASYARLDALTRRRTAWRDTLFQSCNYETPLPQRHRSVTKHREMKHFLLAAVTEKRTVRSTALAPTSSIAATSGSGDHDVGR